jgi:DNA-binding CsgD family transcriptional regulator/tetratricopeptide (TPR) repeat protein
VHERLALALAAEPLGVRAYHVARSALPGDEEAVALLREAAREAERMQAHREALGHLRAALALVPAGTTRTTGPGEPWPVRQMLLDEIAWQATEASDHTIALPALRELVELVDHDPAELGRTRMRLASVLSTNAGNLDGAETEAREAIAAFEGAAPERLAAGINELGWIRALGGDFAAQEDACRQAIAIAERDGDEVTLLHALGPLAHGLALRGRFEEAHAVGERALALATATGDANQIGWHAGTFSMTLALEGRLWEAARVIYPVLAEGSNRSDVAHFTRAWLDWFAGRWSPALHDCEAIAAMHPTEPSAHSAWVLSLGAAILAAVGEPGRAHAFAGQAERVYGERDFYWFSAAHRWGAGQLARLRDDARGAAERFVRAAEWLRECGLSALESQILADVVESLVDAARPDEAGEWAGRARTLADELDTPFARAIADHASAVVTHDTDALRDVATRWGELGSPILRARALERVGGLDALGEAAALYAALPAPVLADRVRAELRRRGPAGRRAAQRVGELTPREREVVSLAASGLTNREIAERLHLSVRTIESHLSRAYAKLAIESRGGLPPDTSA